MIIYLHSLVILSGIELLFSVIICRHCLVITRRMGNIVNCPQFALFIAFIGYWTDNARVPPIPLSATPASERARTDLPGLKRVARDVGLKLWPWQTDTARVALEKGARGRWRYPIVTVCVPRQSGKTTLTGLLAFHRCMTVPDSRVWYTAQSRMDAVGRFRDFVRLLRRSDLIELPTTTRLRAEGWDYRVKLGVGVESIEWFNGSTIQIFAPAEDSLHGSIADLVIMDEARFFDEARGRALMAAALPTMATRNGQLWIISTGGGPQSKFLAAELELSRSEAGNPDTRRAHFEYGIGFDIAPPDLLDRVWAAHPAAGMPGGPVYDALAVAYSAMTESQFAHEYGNRWRSADETRLIPAGRWEAGRWEDMPAGVVFLGVDVAADRSSAAVVACVAGVVQVLDYRPGVTWLADRVLELAETYDAQAVWIDPSGPAGATALELQVRLPAAHTATPRETSAACAAFEDSAITDPPLLGHLASTALDNAVATAAHRKVGQAWQWSRVESGPVLLAASLAYAAYKAALAAPIVAPAIF
jgi:hypothetical protein